MQGDGWENVKNCPICGKEAEKFQLVMTPVTRINVGEASVPLFTHTSWTKCKKCKVEFQIRRLSSESLYEYYASNLYRKLIDNENNEERAENSMGFAKLIVDFFERVDVTATRHLDFGSGMGSLLRKVEWDGIGVDISEKARKWSKDHGVEVYETLGEVEGKFDLVTIIETLEHMPDPVSVLKSLVDRMSIDGKILISVPWADKSAASKIQMGHLFDFNLDAMKFLAKKAEIRGTVISEVIYNDSMISLFYLGEKYGG